MTLVNRKPGLHGVVSLYHENLPLLIPLLMKEVIEYLIHSLAKDRNTKYIQNYTCIIKGIFAIAKINH